MGRMDTVSRSLRRVADSSSKWKVPHWKSVKPYGVFEESSFTIVSKTFSASALVCYWPSSRGSVNASRVVRTDHGTKITDRTYVLETNTAFHLLMRSG
jgi:hypothetical protein